VAGARAGTSLKPDGPGEDGLEEPQAGRVHAPGDGLPARRPVASGVDGGGDVVVAGGSAEGLGTDGGEKAGGIDIQWNRRKSPFVPGNSLS